MNAFNASAPSDESEGHAVTPSTSVLIVGAGPTGLTAALELARFGIPVRIVDKQAAPSTTSRALAVQARTLELFQQRGLSDKMLAVGNRAQAASLYGRGKLLGKIDLSRVPGRHNYVLLISQAQTEQLLTEQLQQQGVRIERGVELESVSPPAPTDQTVRVALRHADDTLETMEAAYVISAEGAHSTIRHALGLPFEGSSLKPSYALADLYIDGAVPDDELSIFISDRGFLAIFPLGEGHFRLIAIEPGDESASTSAVSATGPSLAELQQLYDANAVIPARLHDIVWSSHFRINSRMLKTFRQGRFFFGGDAAHIHSPAGGQGMNTGIQDMIDLGWKLALVLQGKAVPALLDTYQEDRLPVIRRIVSRTEAATDVLNSPSTVVHRLITYLAPLFLNTELVQDLSTKVISEINFDYRDSRLSQTHRAGGKLRAGDRLPDVDVIAWGADLQSESPESESRQTNLYEILNPARLTLLIARDISRPGLPPDWREQLRAWDGVVAVRHIAPSLAPSDDNQEFTTLFGSRHLLLVRPDSYLGFVADAAEWPAMLSWLRRWFPPQAGN